MDMSPLSPFPTPLCFTANCNVRFEWDYLPPVLGEMVVVVDDGGNGTLHIQSLKLICTQSYPACSTVVRELKRNHNNYEDGDEECAN